MTKLTAWRESVLDSGFNGRAYDRCAGYGMALRVTERAVNLEQAIRLFAIDIWKDCEATRPDLRPLLSGRVLRRAATLARSTVIG